MVRQGLRERTGTSLTDASKDGQCDQWIHHGHASTAGRAMARGLRAGGKRRFRPEARRGISGDGSGEAANGSGIIEPSLRNVAVQLRMDEEMLD
jgi:hypothetical protein